MRRFNAVVRTLALGQMVLVAALPAFARPAPDDDEAPPPPGSQDPAAPAAAMAVLDIAHSLQISTNLMSRSPTDAANWLVDNHISKAASQGVTMIIVKNPYRWQPEPFEDYRFGGTVPARRTALHAAIINAKAAHRPMPKLCVYQALPGGSSLSSTDQAILNDQIAVFDEDAWDESIGCDPWQQTMITQRRAGRPQHLEPVWDKGFPAQWSYSIVVTELFMSYGLTQWQLFPSPRPEIRCTYHRPYIVLPGETARAAYIRTVRAFRAYCIPKTYSPVDPLDVYTVLNATPAELNVSCAGDYNGSGFVNGDDFDDFTADFEAGSTFADFDGNGFVNGDDIDAFMVHFAAGC